MLNNRISFDRNTSWDDDGGSEKVNFRFNIVTILAYVIGIVLIVQLFNLQVVNGESYREQSNTRLSRVSTIKAARGSILDRSGNELAGVKTENDIEIYKTNISNDELNESVLNLVNLMDNYQISYSDTFPIKINPFEFTIEGDELTKWKKKYKIDEDANAETAFNKFKDKYQIKNDSIEDTRKIMVIRYIITTTGYSATKSKSPEGSDGWNFFAVFIYSDGAVRIGSGTDKGFDDYREDTFENHAYHWEKSTASNIEKAMGLRS